MIPKGSPTIKKVIRVTKPKIVAAALTYADQPAKRKRESLFMLHLLGRFQNDSTQPDRPDGIQDIRSQKSQIPTIEIPGVDSMLSIPATIPGMTIMPIAMSTPVTSPRET